MSNRPKNSQDSSKPLLEKDNILSPTLLQQSRSSNPSAPRHVSSHICKPGALMHLVQQTDKLVRLNRIMRAYLPPHMQDHARLIAVHEQAWVIQADSSAWATRLRYALPSLRQQLSDHLKRDVPVLKLKVQPTAETKTTEPRRLTLTQQSASFIKGAADSIGDERLGAALLRLASHARKAS